MRRSESFPISISPCTAPCASLGTSASSWVRDGTKAVRACVFSISPLPLTEDVTLLLPRRLLSKEKKCCKRWKGKDVLFFPSLMLLPVGAGDQEVWKEFLFKTKEKFVKMTENDKGTLILPRQHFSATAWYRQASCRAGKKQKPVKKNRWRLDDSCCVSPDVYWEQGLDKSNERKQKTSLFLALIFHDLTPRAPFHARH